MNKPKKVIIELPSPFIKNLLISKEESDLK